jgi:hypothetical protein
MAYSNELWGGPSNTYKYLTDSNTDWGQELLATKQYLDLRGIKKCWFAYAVEPAIPFRSYGIPCEPLPTVITFWLGERPETPPVIDGPVLISAETLSGVDFGSNVLNPYRDFQRLRPSAVIEHGVFVFDGTFHVESAAAQVHLDRSIDFLIQGRPEDALGETRTAVALAPEALQTQLALARVLSSLHRNGESRLAYEHALRLAMALEPYEQERWVPEIQSQMGTK